MGEVYRARDTRLDRIVAIKMLHQTAAVDPGLRLRVEQEARTVAAISHPHICALYDVGREGQIDVASLDSRLCGVCAAAFIPAEDSGSRVLSMASPHEEGFAGLVCGGC